MEEIKILLIEDEKKIADALRSGLQENGYKADVAYDGEMGYRMFRNQGYDLVILDINLPGINGYELCKKIRRSDDKVLVLMLTAMSSMEDKLEGFNTGADDYLVKPFHLEELLLRVKALLKRSGSYTGAKEMEEYSFGKNAVNFRTYQVKTRNAGQKQLGKKEIDLLKLLIENKNAVVPRELILEKVWGYESAPSSRTVDNYIVTFRKYFEDDPKKPRYFHSIRSVGYKFTE